MDAAAHSLLGVDLRRSLVRLEVFSGRDYGQGLEGGSTSLRQGQLEKARKNLPQLLVRGWRGVLGHTNDGRPAC